MTKGKKMLTFKCPKCKGKKLLEIVTGQWSTLVIEGLTPDGEVICGDEDIDGNGDRWFQCGKCGYVLEDADNNTLHDDDQLLEWMKNRGA